MFIDVTIACIKYTNNSEPFNLKILHEIHGFWPMGIFGNEDASHVWKGGNVKESLRLS